MAGPVMRRVVAWAEASEERQAYATLDDGSRLPLLQAGMGTVQGGAVLVLVMAVALPTAKTEGGVR